MRMLICLSAYLLYKHALYKLLYKHICLSAYAYLLEESMPLQYCTSSDSVLEGSRADTDGQAEGPSHTLLTD